VIERMRVTERNSPPLLLSIIWESNVSSPSAFGRSVSERRKGSKGRLKRSAKTPKWERRRKQIDTCTREWNLGAECGGGTKVQAGEGDGEAIE